MSTRIVIVDDHQLVMDGLIKIIKTIPEFTISGTAQHGKELLQLLTQLPALPHIIIMDVDMPFLNGLEATKLVKQQSPEVKVLILTMHQEEIYYNKVIAVRADGLLKKNCTQDELIAALKKISSGTTYFPEKLKSNRIDVAAQEQDDITLTDRETDVLKKIALGMSNSEISEALGISIRTVDTHRTNIKRKLSVNGIAGLVRYAYQNGLL